MRVHLAAAIATSIVLVGCNQHTTGEKFEVKSVSGVQPGMTKEAVKGILGEPSQQTILTADTELWRYSFSTTDASDASAKATGSVALAGAGLIAAHLTPLGGLAMIPGTVVSATTPVSTSTNQSSVEIHFKKGRVELCKLQSTATTMTITPGTWVGGGSSDQKHQVREVLCNEIGSR